MAKKSIDKAKIVVTVESDKKTRKLYTVSLYDNEKKRYWTYEEIESRGVEDFGDLEDMKETLNWNLYGDSSLYRFKWAQSNKTRSTGIAYIFD